MPKSFIFEGKQYDFADDVPDQKIGLYLKSISMARRPPTPPTPAETASRLMRRLVEEDLTGIPGGAGVGTTEQEAAKDKAFMRADPNTKAPRGISIPERIADVTQLVTEAMTTSGPAKVAQGAQKLAQTVPAPIINAAIAGYGPRLSNKKTKPGDLKKAVSGTTDLAEGIMETAAPVAIPAGMVMNPVGTAMGLGAGSMSGYIGEKVAEQYMDPEYAKAVGMLTGLGVGGWMGKFAGENAAAVGNLIRTAKARQGALDSLSKLADAEKSQPLTAEPLGPAAQSAEILKDAPEYISPTQRGELVTQEGQTALDQVRQAEQTKSPLNVPGITPPSVKSARKSAAVFESEGVVPNNKASRRSTTRVPEEGVSEEAARLQDELQRTSKTLTNRDYEQLSPAEAEIIDGLVREGHGFKPEPKEATIQLNSGLGFLNNMFGGGGKKSGTSAAPVAPESQVIQGLAAVQKQAKLGQTATPAPTPSTPGILTQPRAYVASTWSGVKQAARKGEYYMLDDFGPQLRTMGQAIKKGMRVQPSKHIEYLLDHYRSAPGRAVDFFDQNLRPMLREMSPEQYDEASWTISAPHIRDREIYHSGKEVYADLKSTDPGIKAIETKLKDTYDAWQEGTATAADYEQAMLDREQKYLMLGRKAWTEKVQTASPLSQLSSVSADKIELIANSQRLQQQYKPQIDQYTKVVKDLEGQLLDAGILSQSSLDRLNRIYPNPHVRLARILDPNGDSASVAFSGAHPDALAQAKNLVAKSKGGGGVQTDAFTALDDRLIPIFRSISMNTARSTIAKDYINEPVWKDLLRELTPADIKKSGVPTDPDKFFTYMDDGNLKYVEVKDPLLAKSIRQGMRVNDLNVVVSTVARLGRAQRFMTTGAGNLAFGPINLLRDFQGSLVNASYARSLRPDIAAKSAVQGVTGAEPFSRLFGQNKLTRDMIDSGAGFNTTEHLVKDGRISTDRARAGLTDLVTKSGAKAKAAVVVDSLDKMTGMIDSLVSSTERAGRGRIFAAVQSIAKEQGGAGRLQKFYGIPEAMVKAGLSEADANALAAMEANNTMPNFLRRGAAPGIRTLISLTPYLNARFRGTFSFTRAVKTNPQLAAMKVVGGVMMPTAAVTIYNLMDKDRAADYFNTNERTKTDNMVLIRGGEGDEAGKPSYNLPISQDLRPFHNVTRQWIEGEYQKWASGEDSHFEALVNYFHGDDDEQAQATPSPEADLAQPISIPGLLAQGLPLTPTASGLLSEATPPVAREFIEQNVGKDGWDFYRNAPINRHGDMVPRMQYQTGRTPAPLIWAAGTPIGKSLSLSPDRMEHAIGTVLGPGALRAVGASTPLFRAAGADIDTTLGNGGESNFDNLTRRLARAPQNNREIQERNMDTKIKQDAAEIMSGGLGPQHKAVLDSVYRNLGVPKRASKPNPLGGEPIYTETLESYSNRLRQRAARYQALLEIFADPPFDKMDIELKKVILEQKMREQDNQTRNPSGIE